MASEARLEALKEAPEHGVDERPATGKELKGDRDSLSSAREEEGRQQREVGDRERARERDRERGGFRAPEREREHTWETRRDDRTPRDVRGACNDSRWQRSAALWPGERRYGERRNGGNMRELPGSVAWQRNEHRDHGSRTQQGRERRTGERGGYCTLGDRSARGDQSTRFSSRGGARSGADAAESWGHDRFEQVERQPADRVYGGKRAKSFANLATHQRSVGEASMKGEMVRALKAFQY